MCDALLMAITVSRNLPPYDCAVLRTTSVDSSRATDAGKDLILHLSTTVEGLCALCDNGHCNEEWYSAS